MCHQYLHHRKLVLSQFDVILSIQTNIFATVSHAALRQYDWFRRLQCASMIVEKLPVSLMAKLIQHDFLFEFHRQYLLKLFKKNIKNIKN